MTQEQAVQSQAANSGRKPPYLIALVGITLAYLMLECAFNALLLDVAGGQADSHAIEKVEFWGRIISGLAGHMANQSSAGGERAFHIRSIPPRRSRRRWAFM